VSACAEALHLHGLVSHWPEAANEAWVAPLLDWEETQRACRSQDRRLKTAHIGRFKPLCDFDRNWPKRCDCAVIEFGQRGCWRSTRASTGRRPGTPA
jgi:hypothetical protein